jgi:hypothetical protein
MLNAKRCLVLKQEKGTAGPVLGSKNGEKLILVIDQRACHPVGPCGDLGKTLAQECLEGHVLCVCVDNTRPENVPQAHDGHACVTASLHPLEERSI